MTGFDQAKFFEGVAEFVRPYGYRPYGNKKRLTLRKDIQSGWIALSFRIVERFDQIGTGFHYYSGSLYEISRHSLRVEGGEFDRWFIAGNQLHLPDISNIWNIKLDKSMPVSWHTENILRNFPKSHPFFENLCSDYNLMYRHLSSNSDLSTQMINMANARLCHTIALACFLDRKDTVVRILNRYNETLTDAEGREAVINQAVEYAEKLTFLGKLDRQIATDCQRFRTPIA